MAVSDLLERSGVDVAGLTSGGDFLYNLLIFVVAGAVIGIIAWFWATRKTFNKKIEIFEEVSGRPVPVGNDVAREIILPFTSVRAFYLKKRGIHLPRPSIQTGKGHYWYFIRRDGEWVNIGLQNLNDKLKIMNIEHDHSDMRLGNAALKKLIEKNYKTSNWIKEWAPYIGFALLILMLGIAGYLIVGETGKVMSGVGGNVENLQQITSSLESILSSLDNILSTSGVRDAG